MDTLTTLDHHAQCYAETRLKLDGLLAGLRERIETEVIAPHRAELTALTHALTLNETAARRLIAEHPDLFTRPKTQLMHGIKLGLRKRKGKLVIADPAKTVKLLERDYQDDIGVLVKVAKTPVKSALEQLSAAELKRLGVEVTEDTDAVVFDVAHDGLDELLDVLLRGQGDAG